MDDGKVFLARIKRIEATGVYDKGLEVRNDVDDATQGYHAYMAAYAYGHDATVDFCQCMVFTKNNIVLKAETWTKSEPEPEPEAEEPEA